jgi:hypothetical protein
MFPFSTIPKETQKVATPNASNTTNLGVQLIIVTRVYSSVFSGLHESILVGYILFFTMQT